MNILHQTACQYLTEHRSSLKFAMPKSKSKSLRTVSYLAIAVSLALSASSTFAACSMTASDRYSCTDLTAPVEWLKGSNEAASITVSDSTITGISPVHGIYATGNVATIELKGTNSIKYINDTAVLAMGQGGGASIAVSGFLNILINSPNNSNRDGLEADGTDATITHNGVGTIETNGGNAIWANSIKNISVVLAGAAILNVEGEGNNGIKAVTQNGKVVVDTNAIIEVKSDNGHGILSTSTNDSDHINIINSGSITVNGHDSSGIRVESSGNAKVFIDHQNPAVIVSIGNNGVDDATQRTDAISVIKKVNSSGDININVDGTITTNGANRAAGVYAQHLGIGNITITGSNNVTTNASNTGTISSLYSHGLAATTGSDAVGNVTIAYRDGTITTRGNQGHGLYAGSLGLGGDASVINNGGTLTTYGEDANGIYAVSTTGSVTIENSGAITTQNSRGIVARGQGNGNGNVLVQASNNITTGQATVTTHNHGIDASILSAGNVGVNYSNGTINVVGGTSGGGNAIGIAAWDLGSGIAGVNAAINLGANAIVDASKGVTGLQIRSSGSGIINIAGSAEVHGGEGVGVELKSTGASIASYQLSNAGWIDSMNDSAISSSSTTGSHLVIDNHGTIDGFVNFGSEDTIFSNFSSNSWNIRNFADSNGDGVRDTKAVAISDFGAGYDIFNNESTGMVRLAAVTGETNVDLTSEYLPSGSLSIANAGIVQGQLLNLDRFENRGTIDLSDNGLAGDILLITAGNSAGTNGNGQFVADGGRLILDTVLNEGGINSLSDILVLDNVIAGAHVTRLIINHIGGLGALTNDDGIKVVEVLGDADAGSFALGNVVKAGIYEYTLHEGSITTPGNNSLFLRSSVGQINPDVGSYLANQTAATGLFMHTLHDRLGEPQYYQNYKAEDKTIPAVWIRVVAGHIKNEAAGGSLKQNTENTLVHLGGEIANWTGNGDNRYHLGVMGAYGRSETKTTSQVTGSRVNSTVDGYGAGAYLTWYQDPSAIEGWYTDVWSMYNWFDNQTESSSNYHSKSWTTSVEAGYASKLNTLTNYDWMLEPQAQVAYHYYSLEDIRDNNGLNITDSDANGVATRLGARTYLRPATAKASVQPFVEVNWLYRSAKNSMVFNGETISDDTPKNRYETKVGVQGEMTSNVQIYSHIGLQWGENNYQSSQGQLGVRYRF